MNYSEFVRSRFKDGASIIGDLNFKMTAHQPCRNGPPACGQCIGDNRKMTTKAEVGRMLFEACQGMHGDVAQVLAGELVNQLVNAPRDDAKALRDLLNRRPAMNAGLVSEYAKWSGECHLVMVGFPANVPG